MGRLVDEILSRVDIVDVTSRYVQLKKSGSNYAGLSPFKKEKTPSFMVSPSKQIFKDFSSGVGGNVIKFLMEIERIDFRDAIKILAKDAGVRIEDFRENSRYDAGTETKKERSKEIHQLARKFFRQQLDAHEPAQRYLHDQRQIPPEFVEKFWLGFAPDSHYALIEFLKSNGVSDEEIIDAALGKKGNFGDLYSFFRNRVIFPIFDQMGSVIAFGGRVRRSGDEPKYLNSSENPSYEKSKILYGLNFAKNAAREQDSIVVVEGYMDVIAAHRLGRSNAVATCGTAITELHLRTLSRNTKNIFFLFDADRAGRDAAFRATQIALSQEIFPKIISLPEWQKDLDDLANSEDGSEIFSTARADAQDAVLTIFRQKKSAANRDNPIQKQEILNEIFALLAAIPTPPIQMHYLELLASELGRNVAILLPSFKSYLQKTKRFDKPARVSVRGEIPRDQKTSQALALLLDDFLATLALDADFTAKLRDFLQKIFAQNPLLQKISAGTLSEDEKSELYSRQMRREKERADIVDSSKKQKILLRALQETVRHATQDLAKNSLTPQELKSEIIAQKNQLRR